MKVYVLKEPKGAYEDYAEDIVGVFTDYSKVEELVAKQKARVEEQQKQIRICSECLFNKIPKQFKDSLTKPECFESTNNEWELGRKELFCTCKGMREYAWNEVISDGNRLEEFIVEEYELNKEV